MNHKRKTDTLDFTKLRTAAPWKSFFFFFLKVIFKTVQLQFTAVGENIFKLYTQ